MDSSVDNVQSGLHSVAPDELRPMPDTGDEIVLCTDFNRYGTRLAAGSADHRIRIFEKDEDDSAQFRLLDTFRAHNAYVKQVKWHPVKTRPALLASTGDDLKLKIWQENVAESLSSGRRFKCIYSQKSAQAVVYESLSWACPPSITSNTNTYSTILAAVTRDGLISLIEPVATAAAAANPAAPIPSGNGRPVATEEWEEIEQLWVMGNAVHRGEETSFVVDFYAGDVAGVGYGPNYAAIEAGVDERALTLAVTARDEIRVFRLLGEESDGESHYGFGHPPRPAVAEITGAQGVLVLDIKWAPHAWKPRDRLVTAWADDTIRLYEIWTPEDEEVNGSTMRKSRTLSDVKTKDKVQSGIGAGLAGANKSQNDRRFGINQVLHRWQLVATMNHESVRIVRWAREGTVICSMGDDGIAKTWKEDSPGQWSEFAHIGPDTDDWVSSD